MGGAVLTSLVPSLKPMGESKVFLNSMEKRMYAVLGRLGASVSLRPLPKEAGGLIWGTTEGAAAGAGGGGDGAGAATGGGTAGGSCFKVSTYLAFSSAYLYVVYDIPCSYAGHRGNVCQHMPCCYGATWCTGGAQNGWHISNQPPLSICHSNVASKAYLLAQTCTGIPLQCRKARL